MALTRSALRDKGITDKEILDFIMDEHGNTVEAAKEKAKEAAEASASKLQDTITDLQKQLDNAPKPDSSGKDWKAEAERIQGEFDTHKATAKSDVAAKQKELDDFKATVETEKITTAKQAALRKQLQADGANAKLVDLLELKFDIAKIELDGDTIKGWDEISKPVKEQYSDVFGTVETKGTDTAKPPVGDKGKPDPFLEGFNQK